MDGSDLVASMLVGDPRGRALAYDKYADGLHTYCLSLLRDHDAAAVAVHATFIVANDHIGRLPDRGRLRPWLYALARNECIRARDARAGKGVPARFPFDESDVMIGLERNLRRAELRSLVWTGAEGVTLRDREILELFVRHSMDVPDLAAVLRVSPAEAQARLAQAWKELEWSVTILHVAEHARAYCPELAGLLDGWDGHLTLLLRRAAGPHIGSCRTCARHLPQTSTGMDLQVALPIVAAPRALRERTLADVGARRMLKEHQDIALRASAFDPDGFPTACAEAVAPGERAFGRRWAAAMLLPGLLVLGAGLGWRAHPSGAPDTHPAAAQSASAPEGVDIPVPVPAEGQRETFAATPTEAVARMHEAVPFLPGVVVTPGAQPLPPASPPARDRLQRPPRNGTGRLSPHHAHGAAPSPMLSAFPLLAAPTSDQDPTGCPTESSGRPGSSASGDAATPDDCASPSPTPTDSARPPGDGPGGPRRDGSRARHGRHRGRPASEPGDATSAAGRRDGARPGHGRHRASRQDGRAPRTPSRPSTR